MKKSSTRAHSDAQLIRAARKGDRAAFSALVRRYENTVYGFSFKVCRDRRKAQETMQDTFINVYRKLGSFDGKSQFGTWLYSIVANNCLMKHRRRKLHDVMESLDEPPASFQGRAHISSWKDTPVDVLLDKELKALLEKAIVKLPVEYRLVFVMRDIEGESTRETARALNISEEAAKSRLRRARAFLREELNPYMTSGMR
jgi:RNA polymerase sigma-70 factor (ECF subfamily)